MRYTIFAGTNTIREGGIAIAALLGRVPLADGPAIREYEQRFAAIAGTRFAFSFAAGRMALYVLLEALGIGLGDEVIVPAFTCVVVPNAILYRGARPVYVDIDPATFNIDVTQIESNITPRTKAIIAQHTFGLICDIDGITRIARKHGLHVLEDCAHALGASLGGRPAGSLGTAAYFSTDHTKVIGTGTGGMLTTNDSDLAETIARIYLSVPFPPISRTRLVLAAFLAEVVLLHPCVAGIGRYVRGALWQGGLKNAFFLDELKTVKPKAYPYPARLTNVQARIGLSQLHRLPMNLAWRRRLAAIFEEELAVNKGLLEEGYANHAFLRYSFLVEDRDSFKKHFDDVLDLGIWFTSVAHGRDNDLHEIGYQPGSCPVAERVAAHCVNLQTHLRINRPAVLAELLKRALLAGGKAGPLRLNPDARHEVKE